MRRAEYIVAVVLFLCAGVLAQQAVRLGSGWTSTGPAAGFVPFWLALALMVVSLVILLQAVRTAVHQQRPFFPSPAAGRLWLKILLPMVVAVWLIHYLGIYLVAMLYLAVFAAWIGQHRWFVTVSVSVLIPVAMYLSFEKFFKLPLPKSLFYGYGLPF